jgi:hypothetical protein
LFIDTSTRGHSRTFWLLVIEFEDRHNAEMPKPTSSIFNHHLFIVLHPEGIKVQRRKRGKLLINFQTEFLKRCEEEECFRSHFFFS